MCVITRPRRECPSDMRSSVPSLEPSSAMKLGRVSVVRETATSLRDLGIALPRSEFRGKGLGDLGRVFASPFHPELRTESRLSLEDAPHPGLDAKSFLINGSDAGRPTFRASLSQRDCLIPWRGRLYLPFRWNSRRVSVLVDARGCDG